MTVFDVIVVASILGLSLLASVDTPLAIWATSMLAVAAAYRAGYIRGRKRPCPTKQKGDRG